MTHQSGRAKAEPLNYETMELELRPFASKFAASVAAWVRNDGDLLWLAPKTPGPLTEAKILAWHNDRNTPYLAFLPADPVPCGYAELNRMKINPANLWLGHVIIDPQHRRCGLGACLVRLLLRQAFESQGAKTVSLIVFPDNTSALRCYLRCGFVVKRNEYHRFRPQGPKHRMLRLDIERRQWRASRQAPVGHILPADGPIVPISPKSL